MTGVCLVRQSGASVIHLSADYTLSVKQNSIYCQLAQENPPPKLEHCQENL